MVDRILTKNERRRKYAKPKSANKPLARFRNRDTRITLSGLYEPPSPQVPVTGTAQVGLREECQDVLYNFDGVNPLSLYQRQTSYPVLDGYQLKVGGGINRRITAFPFSYQPGPIDPRVQYPALLPTEISDLAWETLARTNPNTPSVHVPQFIGELKDFFELIKGRGASLIKQAAQGYLSWRWVLKPLWSDLQSMLRFQRAVNQRAEMFHNLQNGKEIRKRVKLRSRTVVGNPVSVTVHSIGPLITGKYRVESREDVWGTATWKIARKTRLPRLGRIRIGDNAPPEGQLGWHGQEKFLRAIESGSANLTHESLVTAWELCPWSWLIDWCTSYGDILAATRNAIPVTWSNVAIMRRTQSQRVYYDIGTDASWTLLNKSGYHVESATRKERFSPLLLPFSLPCFMPLIEDGHWQILAALAITSGRLPGIK